MEENEIYKDYFLWNDALWDYYFEGDGNSEQVLLYVDESILKEIGEKNEVLNYRFNNEKEIDNYLEYFYDSIRMDEESVNYFFYRNGRQIEGQRTIPEEYLRRAWIENVLRAYRRQETQTTAVIEFARALASIRNINFSHKCPCLSYVVFLILAYSRTRTYEGVISELRHVFCQENANIEPGQFMELFRSVEDWSRDENNIPRFSIDNIRGNQEIVGVLRYHLVLNREEKTKLKDTLYKYNIDWDESELSYRNFIYNRIFPIVTLPTIKNALRREENYAFFHSLFSSFDPESYIPSDKLPKRQRGHFFLLYDRDSRSLMLKTDVLANEESGNNQVLISADGERECGLYNALFLKRKISIESYSKLSYENEKLIVSSINRDWLFFIMDENYFKQVLTPENDKGCLIITKKDIKEIKDKFKQDDIVDYSHAENLIEAFGRNHYIFYVKAWKSDVILTDREDDDERVADEVPKGPKLTNGILNPAFKRCYLPEALPIIESEEEISVNDIAIYEDQDGNRPAEYIEKKLLGDKIILSLNHITNTYQEFYIKANDEELGVIRVKGSNTRNGENSICYDSWGCAYVDNGENFILRDNSTKYQDPEVITVDNENLYEITCNHRLIPLLKSYAYARKETSRPYLLDRDISKIINYVRLVENWDIDEDEVGYIKYNLINLGVLSMATDECGERRFEVNNPRLIPIGNGEHLLYGAYTFLQIEEIKQSPYVQSLESLSFSDINSESVVVKIKNSHTGFVSGIPVSNESLTKILLEKVECMNLNKFKEKFFNWPTETDENYEGCKFSKISKNCSSNHVQENGFIYSSYKRTDDTFHQIPTSLLKLYERRVNNKPLMMWNKETSTISFTWQMGIPYLVERALCLYNKGIGSRIKVFGMNNCIGSRFYGTITSFKLPIPQVKDEVYRILSDGELGESVGVQSYEEYNGPISLYHRTKDKENDFGYIHEYVVTKDDKICFVIEYDHGNLKVNGNEMKSISTIDDVNDFITSIIEEKSVKCGVPLKCIECDLNNYEKLLIIKN